MKILKHKLKPSIHTEISNRFTLCGKDSNKLIRILNDDGDYVWYEWKDNAWVQTNNPLANR